MLEGDRELPRVLRLLWRTGFVNFGGYLAGGMAAWREKGREMATIPQMTVHDLKAADGRLQPLDVRKDKEWENGHVPGAKHVFLGELRDQVDDLDRSRPYAMYCASGFRASMAASILAANGFEDVRNVPGSWKAWRRPASRPDSRVEGGRDAGRSADRRSLHRGEVRARPSAIAPGG